MKKLDFPNRITVELTNQCNVSCTFCPRQSVNMKIGFMSMELYKKIIDEASDHLPVKLVIFFRGESLLHPEFIECVKYAKDKGIGPIQYATNAFELTNDMADKLLETGIDFISFSLDTLDPEIYRKSRLCGNLDISRDNVIYLSKKCDEKRKKGLQVPTLQVSTVEIEEYMPEQGKFIEFWKKYVDIVRVYYEHDDNGKFRNVEVQRLLEEEVPERKPCRKLFTDLLVYWDGQLALCNYDWRGGLQGLNLNKMTIEEAWNSKLYEQLREAHNNGEIADDIMCQNCQHWRIDYMQNGYLGKLYTRRA
ncbi:hypothetical protein C819_01867 [Lachnospiraceae bacterium 10-1]|nr:hypothetical protein C819_01867 [Lachnospiraceae bacterium 10-1]